MKYSGARATDEMREAWWLEYQSQDDALFCRAYHTVRKRLRPGQFPTMKEFDDVLHDLRDAQWQKQKHAEGRKPLSEPRLGDIRNTARGCEDIKLVMRCGNEGMTPEVIRACRDRWPREFVGVGAVKSPESQGL